MHEVGTLLDGGSSSTLRRVSRSALVLAALLLATAQGCLQERRTAALAPGVRAPLQEAIERRFSRIPRPMRCERLRSVHRAYRLLAALTAEFACGRLGNASLLRVQLHGDLHLEQIAHVDGVTSFTDLDEATEGPAWVDLLRFTVSMSLLVRERGWPSEAARHARERFLDAYLRALRAALEPDALPSELVPEPLRERLASRAAVDPDAASERLAGRLRPLPQSEREAFLRAWRQARPDDGRPRRVGRIEVGVGSAHLDKVLVQIASRDPGAPPRWLEAKETLPSALRGCAGSGAARPERILQAVQRLTPWHQPVFLLRHRGRLYTVHPWALAYAELDPLSDLTSASELIDLAGRAGRWLGAAHARSHADPVRLAERLAEGRERLGRWAERFQGAVWRSWLRARGDACRLSP